MQTKQHATKKKRGNQKIPKQMLMKTQPYEILWDASKAVLRGKFIAIQSHLKKQETSQINNLTLHLKQLEKAAQKNPKVSRRKKS